MNSKRNVINDPKSSFYPVDLTARRPPRTLEVRIPSYFRDFHDFFTWCFMSITVTCTGCRTRFSVAEKYAGRTGACPKCKAPIKIPTPSQGVVIHEPEAAVLPSQVGGKVRLVPILREDTPIQSTTVVFIGVAALACVVLSLLVGVSYKKPDTPPTLLLAATAVLLAFPLAWLGYAMVRDRELEAYQRQSLVLRVTACAVVYAALWGVKSLIPESMTAEMWQWVFLGPFFFFAGSLAAHASLELDWGPAFAHFSLYALATSFLRWCAGLPPL